MICRRALAALALSLAAGTARGAAPACSVSVTGPIQASFRCRTTFIARGDGAVRVLITPEKLPRAVKAIIPAEFELPAPVQPQVYPLDRLVFAKVMLTGPRHATYSAVKEKKERRGDVTVTLTRIERIADGHELMPSLSGRLEARLVPASKGARGEAHVAVTF